MRTMSQDQASRDSAKAGASPLARVGAMLRDLLSGLFPGPGHNPLSNPLPTLRSSTTARPEAPLLLDIDPEALVTNWRYLNELSGTARAGAVVKAQAYGIGSRRVVPHLHRAGCRNFFTSYLSEAADILQFKFIDPSEVAFLHGPLSYDEAIWAKALGIRPVINTLAQARLWNDVQGGLCDIMVDTGINRIGLSLADLSHPAVAALQIDIVHSHLASAEEESSFNRVQQERWKHALGVVAHRRAALANSAGIALGRDFHGDVTRPGLALFGGVPCPAMAGKIRQVVTPRVLLMQVRDIKAGETIGYNQTFVAGKAMRIGVVSIGYADGYLRCWSGKGAMLHRGRRLPILGRVSMDMTVVDLEQAPDLREGDWVEVDYDLAKASRLTGLTQYELLTLLADRFVR